MIRTAIIMLSLLVVSLVAEAQQYQYAQIFSQVRLPSSPLVEGIHIRNKAYRTYLWSLIFEENGKHFTEVHMEPLRIYLSQMDSNTASNWTLTKVENMGSTSLYWIRNAYTGDFLVLRKDEAGMFLLLEEEHGPRGEENWRTPESMWEIHRADSDFNGEPAIILKNYWSGQYLGFNGVRDGLQRPVFELAADESTIEGQWLFEYREDRAVMPEELALTYAPTLARAPSPTIPEQSTDQEHPSPDGSSQNDAVYLFVNNSASAYDVVYRFSDDSYELIHTLEPGQSISQVSRPDAVWGFGQNEKIVREHVIQHGDHAEIYAVIENQQDSYIDGFSPDTTIPAPSPDGSSPDDAIYTFVNNSASAYDVVYRFSDDSYELIHILEPGQSIAQVSRPGAVWGFGQNEEIVREHVIQYGDHAEIYAVIEAQHKPQNSFANQDSDLSGEEIPIGFIIKNQNGNAVLQFTDSYNLIEVSGLPDPHRSRWWLEDVDNGGYKLIRTSLYNNLYLYVSGDGKLALGKVDSSSHSAMWKIIPQSLTQIVQIQNRQNSSLFMNNQNGSLSVSRVQPGSASTMWALEKSPELIAWENDNPQSVQQVVGPVATSPICWKDSYGRGVGEIPGRVADCPSGYTNNGATCGRGTDDISAPSRLANCPPGYTNNGPAGCGRGTDDISAPSRLASCPKGYTNMGLDCQKGANIFKRKPASSMRCPTGYFKNNVTQRCHKNCPEGYRNMGETCHRTLSILGPSAFSCPTGYFKGNITPHLCHMNCPQGYTNMGETCHKPVSTLLMDKMLCRNDEVREGARCYPKVGRCGSNKDDQAGLCYSKCKSGYDGVGPVCWSTQCSAAYPVDCGASCAASTEACVGSIVDQSLSSLDVLINVAIVGSTLGSGTGAIAASTAIRATVKRTASVAVKKAAVAVVKTELKRAGKKLGRELAEEAAMNAAFMIVDAAQDAEFDPALLDPTGIAYLVQAFHQPLCADVR